MKQDEATEEATTVYWLVVWQRTDAFHAKALAQTADMELVKTVIKGLHENHLLEDDEQDRIFDPEFIRSVPAVVAGLARRSRQAACRGFPDEVNEEDEVN